MSVFGALMVYIGLISRSIFIRVCLILYAASAAAGRGACCRMYMGHAVECTYTCNVQGVVSVP